MDLNSIEDQLIATGFWPMLLKPLEIFPELLFWTLLSAGGNGALYTLSVVYVKEEI